jgi:hypothetical protein
MRRIFRYEVPVDDQLHTIALNAGPISVGCRQPDRVEFWAIHDDDAASYSGSRIFIVVGTGHPLPAKVRAVHGTAVAPGGDLVWHLVEVES